VRDERSVALYLQSYPAEEAVAKARMETKLYGSELASRAIGRPDLAHVGKDCGYRVFGQRGEEVSVPRDEVLMVQLCFSRFKSSPRETLPCIGYGVDVVVQTRNIFLQ